MVSSEWIDKQVYHTGGIKRNTKEIINPMMTWIYLRIIILCERSENKRRCCAISLI
jgi:hypothetical protein